MSCTLHVVYQFSLKQSFMPDTFYTFAVPPYFRVTGFIVLCYTLLCVPTSQIFRYRKENVEKKYLLASSSYFTEIINELRSVFKRYPRLPIEIQGMCI
jgi:hypothetical protein